MDNPAPIHSVDATGVLEQLGYRRSAAGAAHEFVVDSQTPKLVGHSLDQSTGRGRLKPFGFLLLGIAIGGGSIALGHALFAHSQIPVVPTPVISKHATTVPALRASGYVVAQRTATISSDEIGILKSVLVKPGERVRTGQIVAILDSDRQELALQQADATYHVAVSRDREARAAFDGYEPTLRRLVALGPTGFTTRASVEDAQAHAALLAAQIHTADREMEAQAKARASAQRAKQYRYIRAPFDGLVSELNAQVGEIVSPSSAGNAFTRTGVCTIIDRSRMFALVEIDESLIGSLQVSKHIEVIVPAIGKRFSATVDTLIYEIDRSKGTGKLRLEIHNPTPDLIPNMSIRVESRS